MTARPRFFRGLWRPPDARTDRGPVTDATSAAAQIGNGGLPNARHSKTTQLNTLTNLRRAHNDDKFEESYPNAVET